MNPRKDGEPRPQQENIMSIASTPDEDTADTRPAPTDEDGDARNSTPQREGADPRNATDTPATPRIKNK